ncbi:hypothetical protein [Nocardia brevicatena]|uniref:hypothetical protein n=1 Tax=Nocardia brevicatena TaxID=37327 RepID=UPI00030087F8|nr:hypothetical protein [Nocardia brevicatena]
MAGDRLLVGRAVSSGEDVEELALRVGIDPVDHTAHLQISVGPVGIVDAERDSRILLEIAEFGAIGGGGHA